MVSLTVAGATTLLLLVAAIAVTASSSEIRNAPPHHALRPRSSSSPASPPLLVGSSAGGGAGVPVPPQPSNILLSILSLSDEDFEEIARGVRAEELRRRSAGSNHTERKATTTTIITHVPDDDGAAHPLRTRSSTGCLETLQLLCNSTIGEKCIACATAHKAAVLAANCTNARVDTICNSGELTTVQFIVTPPVPSGMPNSAGEKEFPYMASSFVRYGNFSTDCPTAPDCDRVSPPGYIGGRAVKPGEVISLGVSNNPHDRYVFTSTATVPALPKTDEATFYVGAFDMHVLQLRVEVDAGALATTPTLHWQTFYASTGFGPNISGCFNSNIQSSEEFCIGNFSDDYSDMGNDDYMPPEQCKGGWFGTTNTNKVSGDNWVQNQTVLTTGINNRGLTSWPMLSGWTVRYVGGPTQ
jgi:hypothetical protein